MPASYTHMSEPVVISNIRAYLAVATDALAASKHLEASHRRPKSDGSPGWIIAYDPIQRSFKQSLIAIVFAGIYLDALLYIVGTQRLGNAAYGKIERREYEEKLKALEVTDADTLKACNRFRIARNDIVHEKADEPVPSTDCKLHIAQLEAEHALAFVAHVSSLLWTRPPTWIPFG